jgi:TetR/AcrR family fatty acid metabolism transcriptional regulator
MPSQISQDKHNRIIEAAIKVFAKKGFFNARISEIAKEANVADGTIYLYFKSKDDILIHLFEESMDRLIKLIQSELAKEDNPISKLKRFIQLHFTLVEGNPNLAEVITVELRQSNKFMKEYNNVKFRDYLNLISSVIREGQNQGMIRRDVKPAIIKRAIFGALDEVTLPWALSEKKKYSLNELAEQVTNLFINGIIC